MTHVALIFTCIVSTGLLVERRFAHAPRVERSDQSEKLLGKQINIPGVQWQAGRNVVLYVSSRCAVCAESLPFYEQIAALHENYPLSISVITPDSEKAIVSLFSGSRIRFQKIHTIAGRLDGLGLTPTLLLVGADGKVWRAFVGKLSEDREVEVLNLLRHGTA